MRNFDIRKFKIRIMRRVYGIWFLRHAAPLLALELIVLALAVNFFANYVFVEEVVTNTLNASLGNPLKMAGYLVSAFLETRLVTQFIIAVLFIGLVMFLKDINRSVIAYAAMKRRELSASSN